MVKSGGGARFERIKCQCSRKVVEALHDGSHAAIGEDDRQVEAEALALPFVQVRSCCNVARGRQSHLDRSSVAMHVKGKKHLGALQAALGDGASDPPPLRFVLDGSSSYQFNALTGCEGLRHDRVVEETKVQEFYRHPEDYGDIFDASDNYVTCAGPTSASCSGCSNADLSVLLWVAWHYHGRTWHDRWELSTPAQVVRGPCVQRSQQHQSVGTP